MGHFDFSANPLNPVNQCAGIKLRDFNVTFHQYRKSSSLALYLICPQGLTFSIYLSPSFSDSFLLIQLLMANWRY